MAEFELASRLQLTPLRFHMHNLRTFAEAVASAMASLTANKPDRATVLSVIESMDYCLRIGSVGGRPVLDSALGKIYVGPVFGSGSYNRVQRCYIDGTEYVLRTLLRRPEEGSKSVRVFAIESAIHALISGDPVVPKLICPIKTFRDRHGVDVGAVIEYVGDQTLLDVFESDDITDEVAFDLVRKVMDALVRLDREYGFQHRDLRADNVMVCGDGIKIIDFGFAKLGAYGLDCNPEGGCVRTGDVPKSIDVMMLLFTLMDDCPLLPRRCPRFTGMVTRLLDRHLDHVRSAIPNFARMDAESRWYFYQRHCVYEAPDCPELHPKEVARRCREQGSGFPVAVLN